MTASSMSFSSRLQRVLKSPFQHRHKPSTSNVSQSSSSSQDRSINHHSLPAVTMNHDDDDGTLPVMMERSSPLIDELDGNHETGSGQSQSFITQHHHHQYDPYHQFLSSSAPSTSTVLPNHLRDFDYTTSHDGENDEASLPSMLVMDDPLETKYLLFKSQSDQQLQEFLGAVDDGHISDPDFDNDPQTVLSRLDSIDRYDEMNSHSGTIRSRDITEQQQRFAQMHHFYESSPDATMRGGLDRRVRVTAGGQLIVRRRQINIPPSHHHHHHRRSNRFYY